MKKISKILLIAVGLLLLTFGQALAEERQYDVVRVNGSVTREVNPDTAFVSVGVMTQGKTAEEAKASNVVITDNIISSLRAYGIARADIKTTNYSLRPDYREVTKGKREVVGYTMNYTLSVKVGDLDKLGAVIDLMFADGANTFNNVTFTVSDKKSIERELLALAVENAAEKAGIVANAGGRTLGKLLTANIGSVGGMDYNESNYDNVMLRKSVMASAPATQIMGGSLMVSAEVDVTFELL